MFRFVYKCMSHQQETVRIVKFIKMKKDKFGSPLALCYDLARGGLRTFRLDGITEWEKLETQLCN